MVKRIGGQRRKTRHKLKKETRGRMSIARFMQIFKPGEKAVLKAEPAYQKGMYHPRFHGLTGTIQSMNGKCCEIMIKDGNKEKSLIVHPVHLKRI